MASTKPFLALFPGQGSQQVGMGKSLFESFAVARETFEEASEALKLDVKKLCFDGPESDLTLTENAQPALVTVSTAAYRVFQKEYSDAKPILAAGHSLGEYSALVATGALAFPDAVRWVRLRGQAMQKAVPVGEGSMAAIMMLEDDVVRDLCTKATEWAQSADEETFSGLAKDRRVVEPANFNAPGQIVISGNATVIDKVLELIKTGGYKGKATKLSVSAPFHSSLMKPAAIAMDEAFQKSGKPAAPLKFPYIANRTGKRVTESQAIFPLLVEQVDHAVLWKQSMERAAQESPAFAIEFGSGKVLAGLMRRIVKDMTVLNLETADQLGEIQKWI